jgi:ferredoxin
MNKIGKKPDVAENKLSTDEKTRRGVISGLIFLIVSLFTKKVHAYDYDGGLAPLKPKQKPVRINPIIPAGAESIANFRRNCTGCQLCVTVCKNNVLRPSSKLSEFMQPHMSFERGYCRPECVKCSEVCPTSAITPITPAEKSATQIGFAVWLPDNCVVLTDRVNCDLCAVKCPTGAITRIDYPDIPNAKIPMIDDNRCIGCGACEQLCPARPHSAIYVEGVDTHRTI